MQSTPSIPTMLAGKSFEFDYDDAAYLISIQSETELQWKLVRGTYDGIQKDTERYYASSITDDILFISWVEASGLGLYSVLNFRTNELVTHARENENTFINTGTVRAL